MGTCEIWARAEGTGTISTNAREVVRRDSATFVAVLNTFGSVVAIEDSRSAHEQIIQSGWDSNAFMENCLVDMYAKCRSMEQAWNAILA